MTANVSLKPMISACRLTILPSATIASMLRRGGVGDAVRQEIVGQSGDPLATSSAVERHRLADDIGMELLALGENGGERRGADRAAEIAQHVGEARGRACFSSAQCRRW